VLDKMDLRHPGFGIITIAGTNGKGSTAAMLEAILCTAGYQVGTYTSPHLIVFNERARLNRRPATDEELCSAFEHIESIRGETPLTYFEYGTVVVLELFRSHQVDIAVLEVGLGGRLDAVNGVDADVAVISSIGIDHTSWLGSDREVIGREKAGIFRANRPAVCSDPAPPASVAQAAAETGAKLLQLNRDFFVERSPHGWTWRYLKRIRSGLPYPAARGDHQVTNAAGALMALESLDDRFPVTQMQIREGLHKAAAPGRFQVLPGRPVRVLDVAHNPQAAAALAATLKQQPVNGKTLAVFGMLRDKPVVEMARVMQAVVDGWYAAALDAPRGATADELIEGLTNAGVTENVSGYPDVGSAYAAAARDAKGDDRIVVFGSFYTVGAILALHNRNLLP